MRSFKALIATLAVAVVAAPVAMSAQAADAPKNIVETAVGAGQFSTLVSLVQKAGLADTLAAGGPFTVFAPTDAAFAKVPKATLDALAADPAKLKAVLLHHVVRGDLAAADVVGRPSLTTLEGTSAGRLAVKVDGGTVTVGGAKVVTPDVKASNGVIHVIDSVLIPTTPAKSIVQTAVAAGQFKTLASLLKTAGLVGTLSGKGAYTVFAPTDAAFKKVPKATLATLAKNKAKLRSVLLYHVAKGALFSDGLANTSSVKTLNGKSLTVKPSGETLAIGAAKVRTADIAASNGVIHVIDKVLIPAA